MTVWSKVFAPNDCAVPLKERKWEFETKEQKNRDTDRKGVDMF